MTPCEQLLHSSRVGAAGGVTRETSGDQVRRSIVPGFADLLRSYRERAGLSQRALARASKVNPAIISRLESNDRGPSGPEQVLAIARALGLDAEQSDSLLASAGYWPSAFLALGPQDATLTAVARVLAASGLGDDERARFRRVVELLAEQWTVVSQRGSDG